MQIMTTNRQQEYVHEQLKSYSHQTPPNAILKKHLKEQIMLQSEVKFYCMDSTILSPLFNNFNSDHDFESHINTLLI